MPWISLETLHIMKKLVFIMNNIIKNYFFTWYIDVTKDKIKILEKEPTSIDWIEFSMRELLWWEYFEIQEKSISIMPDTRMYTINDIKRRKLFLEYGISSINRHVDNVINNIYLSDISGEAGELLAYKYHLEKCILSEDEKKRLADDVRNYKNPEDSHKIKVPYSRIFIELDMMRHFGGYSRDDLYNISKKDLDAIYFLRQLGMPWSSGKAMVNNPNNVNKMSDNEILKEYANRKHFVDRIVELQKDMNGADNASQ